MGGIVKDRWIDASWLLACLLGSTVWCVSAANELSATFDEPVYIQCGLDFWRSGSHAGLMRLGTMPLPADWDTLPLYLHEIWTGTLIDTTRDLDHVLPWARYTSLAFWWLLLVYGWRSGRSLAGPWGGRLTAAWLACEPNLLAHAALATTDIPVTACLMALVFHFRNGRESSWWPRIGVPGLWFGAALLAKASALAFGPLCMAAVEVYRLWKMRPWPVRSSVRDLVHIAAIGFVLAFAFCGSDWRPEPSFVAWAHKLPAVEMHDAMVWLSEHLCIFSNAGEGLVRQVKHNLRGHHGSYLLGQAYPQPLWYYFPVALAIKLSLPLLWAPLVIAATRRRAAWSWAAAVAFVLFLFSLNCRVQIGIRLVLPLVAFLILAVANNWAELVAATRGWPRRMWFASSFAALIWTGIVSWRVWPEGLCYVNELWGGSANGYLYLSDSNYDWGQGIKELADWSKNRDLTELNVWYFGTDPGVNSAPLRHLPLHLVPIARPSDVKAFVPGRYVAVGTTLLYGTSLGLPDHRATREFFRSQQPIARTSTFLIYDLGERVAQRQPNDTKSE